MVKAVIDLGTNSVKCLIASVGKESARILLDLNKTTRLGEEIAATGRIGTRAMERNLLFLREIQRRCQELRVEKVVCVGAETLRRSQDTAVFKNRIYGEFGWELRTLSPRDEARLIFKASARMAPPGVSTLVFDTGGGSTEFSWGRDGAITSSYSLPLGAVILTSKFINSDPVSREDLTALSAYVGDQLTKLIRTETPFTIGCGGCLTTLAAVALKLGQYDAGRIQGFSLTQQEVARQVDLYRESNDRERKNITGLPADRADIILAGAVIVLEILGYFSLSGIAVSTYGLRHALLEGIKP